MEKLLDLREVAHILGISPVTAKIWASKRKFPVVKVGRLVRIAPDALAAWIQENTKEERAMGNQNPRPRGQKRPKTGSFEGLLDELRSDGAIRGRK